MDAIFGFDWDLGNNTKNRLKHGVTSDECEQLFFNLPFKVQPDASHSLSEKRFQALGTTDLKRGLFVVFTIRGNRIRVISAREMSRKEKEAYEDIKTDPEV